jgi:dipeptide/tripeptide permease
LQFCLYFALIFFEGNDFEDCKIAISQFPKDIYYVFYLKFLESYSYFALSQILVIYLHTEFGVSDIEAGMVYGMWGAAITLWGLLVSWINDNLGVRYSLMAGFTISAVSSTVVACTTSKALLYITLFAIYPFGTSMGIPMLT